MTFVPQKEKKNCLVRCSRKDVLKGNCSCINNAIEDVMKNVKQEDRFKPKGNMQ